ncbi:hypothetical protein B0O80DRAFT_455086 [Mortierella sp. GBAus27b]|nr:hypothetical protein BGX31_000005 [Mortierella sp. GBA43]KAI8351949.1 hypothetical protein B0O80DRAFT_455086 [Mortierella sp. GBAus27b]
MTIAFFDILLLKDTVTKYLSHQDLAQCVLVSQAWFKWFTPVLWHTLDFDDWRATSPEGFAALARHQNHVREVLTFEIYLTHAPGAPRPFSNLRALKYSPINSCLQDAAVLRMIPAMPTLQSLTLTLALAHRNTENQLVRILHSLPNLKSFNLTCYQITLSTTVQQIINACSRLEQLRLNFGGISSGHNTQSHGNAQEQHRIAKNAMDQMPDTQIRELSIRLSLEEQESALLITLLERCPRLEKLDIKWLHDPQTLKGIVEVLERRVFPQLKHIRLGPFGQASDERLAGLISALGHEGRDHANWIRSSGYHVQEGKRNGLVTFKIKAGLAFELQSVQSLIRSHADTLTVLDLMSLRRIKVRLFMELMGHLPKLRTVMVPVWLGQDEGFEEGHVFETPWICNGITHLRLGLQLMGNMEDHRAGSGSLADRFIQYMFLQIGRLKELEEWRLATSTQLISVDVGYMDCLKELKQLKCLDLTRSHNNQLGIKEAEWMLNNWARLIHLVVSSGNKSARSRAGPSDDVRLALLARRPWMQIE